MADKISFFITIAIFSVPISYCLFAFAKEKFPVVLSRYKNYIVWGDKSVNPRLLTGRRARMLSALFGGLFLLFILVLYKYNPLIFTTALSNLVSVLIGATIGAALYQIALRKA